MRAAKVCAKIGNSLRWAAQPGSPRLARWRQAPRHAPPRPRAPALTRRALALRAGHDQLTDSRGFRELPRGCYDVGDGYLNPVDNLVYQYRTSAVRRPQYKRLLEY